MPFVNMRITAGDETWKAIVNYFVYKFSYFVFSFRYFTNTAYRTVMKYYKYIQPIERL